MRVWVDLTNSPHVLVLRPVIELLRARGHEVEVTARDFAQTLQLCARFGIEPAVVGHHRGGRVAAKAPGLASRSAALVRWARGRAFDLALGRGRPLAVVRTPPAVSLYHRFENDLFARVLRRLRVAGAQVVVLPRTPEQRAELAGESGFVVPERAVDAQSLVAYADVVVSAGGTMNREAVALGTPVWTTFEGRMGAVDERLIAEGRLRRLRDPAEIELRKRDDAAIERAA